MSAGNEFPVFWGSGTNAQRVGVAAITGKNLNIKIESASLASFGRGKTGAHNISIGIANWREFTEGPHDPPVVLPDSPGYYVGDYSESPSGKILIELLTGGQWVDNTDSRYLEDSWVAELGNLTRLVPADSASQ